MLSKNKHSGDFVGITRKGFRNLHDDVRASNLFPAIAYDANSKVFVCDDKNVGVVFLCEPMMGADEAIQEQITTFLNQSYPSDTVLSFSLWRSPDIIDSVNDMKRLRLGKTKNPLLKKIVDGRSEFLLNGTEAPIIPSRNIKAYDTKIIVSIKIPTSSSMPSSGDLIEASVIAGRIKSFLDEGGMRPKQLEPDTYLRLMSTIINGSKDASWSNGLNNWDPDKPISDQILDFNSSIEVTSQHLKIGDVYSKTLSAKRLSDGMFMGDAVIFAGDLSGQNNGVKGNYLVTTNLTYRSVDKEKAKLSKRRTLVVNQSHSSMLKFVPVLGDKKRNFDILEESMNENFRPVKISYSIVLFNKDKEELEAMSMTARTYWSQKRFTMMEDKYAVLPVFLNSLPLCSDVQSSGSLNRDKTMTVEQAAPILPIFGEWKGTGTPHVNMFSRNGQLMTFSFHDTDSNMNGVIAATSGSGKSFLMNEVIASYMSAGGMIWGIDVGHSYSKLSDALDGDFISFESGSGICLAPFEIIQDYEEEEDALVSMVEAMAAPNEGLTDLQISGLKRVMSDQYLSLGKSMSIDSIKDALESEEQEELRNIGRQLYQFSSKGSYGKYFNGKNNLNFANAFTVLELEELKSKKHLQQVVLLQLMYQIQQEVYLGDRDRPKTLFIDEAWDLLAGGGDGGEAKKGPIAKFIETAYRRFRKYGANVIIITQSLNDLYENPVGRAIAENSATKCLLGQSSETVENLKKESRLAMSEGAFEVLKTVKTIPTVYSEIFIQSSFGQGIARLVVSDFNKLLYSTKAEEVHMISELKKKGLTTVQAIDYILESRGSNNG